MNDNQWTRPSPGRLGTGEGEYVQEAGFGHEDWNFNYDLAIDGFLYGYVYYPPAQDKQDETFNFAFATYQTKQWYLVGFYKNCRFVRDGAPADERVLNQKVEHLMQLKTDGSLGKIISDQSKSGIFQFLKSETKHLRWKVHVSDAILLPHPVPIPKDVVEIRNFHIPRPTGVDERVFNKLLVLGLREISSVQDIFENTEFPEGREAEITHLRRERSPALVKAAKDQFRKKHGRLFCQVCDFDFKARYGNLGEDFIEAHHLIPVKDLPPDGKTKISDIAIVCANCHRMFHKSKRWLHVAELKALLSNPNELKE